MNVDLRQFGRDDWNRRYKSLDWWTGGVTAPCSSRPPIRAFSFLVQPSPKTVLVHRFSRNMSGWPSGHAVVRAREDRQTHRPMEMENVCPSLEGSGFPFLGFFTDASQRAGSWAVPTFSWGVLLFSLVLSVLLSPVLVLFMSKRRSEYLKYLGSAEWRALRSAAFERDGWKCRHCGNGKNLRGHHVRYGKDLRAVSVDCILTLCEKCHEGEHRKLSKLRKQNRKPRGIRHLTWLILNFNAT